MYNWQKEDWTSFSYKQDQIEEHLFQFTKNVGAITGVLENLPEDLHAQSLIDVLVSEALKTSEIEGEFMNRKDVMSSVKKILGINIDRETRDVRAKGIGALVTSVQNTFIEPLSKEMLFDWHSMIFQNSSNILVGQWRANTDPMQVISGASGKEKIHFEAPPSNRIPVEMDKFIHWYNDFMSNHNKLQSVPIFSAISHLYFETLHPFEDGNGRVGRALAEKALIQNVGNPLLISLSATIEKDKRAYYDALQLGQRSNEITSWLSYFIQLINDALTDTQFHINFTLKKTRLFDAYKNDINPRQEKALKKMLVSGNVKFEGGMTAKKYMRINRVSKATATRDLKHLLEIGVFQVLGKGRSTSYEVKI